MTVSIDDLLVCTSPTADNDAVHGKLVTMSANPTDAQFGGQLYSCAMKRKRRKSA